MAENEEPKGRRGAGWLRSSARVVDLWALLLAGGLYVYPNFWLFLVGLLLPSVYLGFQAHRTGREDRRSGKLHKLYSKGAKAVAEWLAARDVAVQRQMISVYFATVIASALKGGGISGAFTFCILFHALVMNLVTIALQHGAGIYSLSDARAALGKWTGATAAALAMLGGVVLVSYIGIGIFSEPAMKSYLGAAVVTSWIFLPILLFGLVIIWLHRLDLRINPFDGGFGKQLDRIDRALAAE